MPIYAYQCQACGHDLEAIQKISDARLTECPECHKAELKKMLTAPAFRLSGSGWYETDFKKDGKKNLAGDKPSSGASSDTASSAGSSGSGSATPTPTSTPAGDAG